jgi:transcriptional regulator of heat shock response
MQPELSRKQLCILEAIVASYIRRGRPAGSSYLAADSEIEMSPASIRNVMAQLECLGLVTKPHVSAGRAPTEAGYRLYVDRFARPCKLGGREIRAIRDAIEPALDAGTILERISRQLESLSRMTSVALLARRGDYDTYIFGIGNMVSEACDLSETRSLLRVLESKEAVARAFLRSAGGSGVHVTIGSENPVRHMKSCSIVSCSCRVGKDVGALGVIGPLRMEYPRIITLIEFASSELTRRLAARGRGNESAN